jgi:hypothetical protein
MVRFIPAKVWASWPWPNYVDPVRHPATIALYAINGVFLGIATLAVVARLYTRVILRNWFGLDDLFLVLAFVWLLKTKWYEYRTLIESFRYPPLASLLA